MELLTKNYIILFIISITWLIGEETSFSQPVEKILVPKEKRSFLYTNYGFYYAGDIQGLDFGVGYRTVHQFSGFDINLGGTWVSPVVLPFLQGSYLYYPLKENGPYTGVGVSWIPYTGWGALVNFPLIAGYQTSNKHHPVFAQFQLSLITVPGATFTLGIGF